MSKNDFQCFLKFPQYFRCSLGRRKNIFYHLAGRCRRRMELDRGYSLRKWLKKKKRIQYAVKKIGVYYYI